MKSIPFGKKKKKLKNNKKLTWFNKTIELIKKNLVLLIWYIQHNLKQNACQKQPGRPEKIMQNISEKKKKTEKKSTIPVALYLIMILFIIF